MMPSGLTAAVARLNNKGIRLYDSMQAFVPPAISPI
jgi:hypothetical protein